MRSLRAPASLNILIMAAALTLLVGPALADVQIAYDLSESRISAFGGLLELSPERAGQGGELSGASALISLSGLPANPVNGPASVEQLQLGEISIDEDLLGIVRLFGVAIAEQVGASRGVLMQQGRVLLDAKEPFSLSTDGMIACEPVDYCAPISGFPIDLKATQALTPIAFDLHDLDREGQSWVSGRIELEFDGQTATIDLMGREVTRVPVPEPASFLMIVAGCLSLFGLQWTRKRNTFRNQGSRRRRSLARVPAPALAFALAISICLTACEVKVYEIPLHVIALSDDDGGRATTVTQADFASRVDYMNSLYGPAGIQFTFDPARDWETRQDTELNNLQNSGADYWVAPNAVAARYPGKIVIFLRFGPDNTAATSGFAYPPSTTAAVPSAVTLPTEDISFIAFPNRANALPANTNGFLAHEVGHYLGLYHTHPNWGDDEDAMQIRLHVAGLDALDGDGLDDTAPDAARAHFFTNTGLTNRCDGSGVYSAPSFVTPGGIATIAPDRDNVMGYFRCGTQRFTASQILLLRSTLQHESRRHLIEPVCPADHHRLPAGEFQRCVDYWTHKGRWPVSVSASELGGSVYMTSSIAVGNPRPVRHMASSAAYQAAFDDASENGFRPEQVQGFLVDGRTLYNAVWAPGDGYMTSAHTMSISEFETQFDLMVQRGWALVDLNFHDGPSQTRVAATWVDRPHDGYIAHYDMTRSSYADLFSDYHENGYEVIRFSSYSTPEGIRYSALWHPSEKNSIHHPFQTPAEHQTNYEALRLQGYQLLQLHDYNGLISAIWR